MGRIFTHILFVITTVLSATGCIFDNFEDADVAFVEQNGMRVTFTLKAGKSESPGTKAIIYDTPQLENGTVWENYVNLDGGDYLFYLFNGDGVFCECLTVNSIIASDNNTYIVTADVKEKYKDFTIVALANWRTNAWDMLSGGYCYPLLISGISKIQEIWNSTAGVRVYDAAKSSFMPSSTSLIPMYGAKTYSLNNSSYNTAEVNLGTLYLIRSLAKIDVYVSQSSGIMLEEVKLNRYSNCFHCAPVGLTSMDDQWDQATGTTLNINKDWESFSPSSLDFVWIEDEGLYRLYVPEYPNLSNDVEPSTISVSMRKDGLFKGGTIKFEGKETTSSSIAEPLDILRNNYYKFNITGLTEYETNVVMDIVPFDEVSNDIIFE